MNTTGSLYMGLLLTALVGSLGHCLGMCGPLVLILGAQVRRQSVLLFRRICSTTGAGLGSTWCWGPSSEGWAR